MEEEPPKRLGLGSRLVLLLRCPPLRVGVVVVLPPLLDSRRGRPNVELSPGMLWDRIGVVATEPPPPLPSPTPPYVL